VGPPGEKQTEGEEPDQQWSGLGQMLGWLQEMRRDQAEANRQLLEGLRDLAERQTCALGQLRLAPDPRDPPALRPNPDPRNPSAEPVTPAPSPSRSVPVGFSSPSPLSRPTPEPPRPEPGPPEPPRPEPGPPRPDCQSARASSRGQIGDSTPTAATSPYVTGPLFSRDVCVAMRRILSRSRHFSRRITSRLGSAGGRYLSARCARSIISGSVKWI